MNDLAPLLC